jgi:hypothetical protein
MEFGINFDKASKEWRKNKIKKKNGNFIYKCGYVYPNGKKCANPQYNNCLFYHKSGRVLRNCPTKHNIEKKHIDYKHKNINNIYCSKHINKN